MDIYAIVVTYNRKEVLVECLEALKGQTRSLQKIVVIDNASTDGTNELFNNNDSLIFYYRLEQNTGGAGGFSIGLKLAVELGADFCWIMDDDVIPKPEALQKLEVAMPNLDGWGFLCSRVVGVNGRSMNTPEPDFRAGPNNYPIWDEKLIDGAIRVRSSTFVSVLIPADKIIELGLPFRQMFIWGDDGEYTYRLSNVSAGYLIAESIVLHKREGQKKLSLIQESNLGRIKNYYYYYRNNYFLCRKHKERKDIYMYLYSSFRNLILILVSRGVVMRWTKLTVLVKGLWAGSLFDPNVEYPHVKRHTQTRPNSES